MAAGKNCCFWNICGGFRGNKREAEFSERATYEEQPGEKQKRARSGVNGTAQKAGGTREDNSQESSNGGSTERTPPPAGRVEPGRFLGRNVLNVNVMKKKNNEPRPGVRPQHRLAPTQPPPPPGPAHPLPSSPEVCRPRAAMAQPHRKTRQSARPAKERASPAAAILPGTPTDVATAPPPRREGGAHAQE